MSDDESKAPEPGRAHEQSVRRESRSLETVCGAKTRAGGICSNAPMQNGRCRYHGGKAPRGVKHGNFTSGKYLRALDVLAEAVDERLSDPLLVDPRRSVAVQENVVAQFMELSEHGDGPEFRETLRARMNDAMELLKEDVPAGLAALRSLQRYIVESSEKTRALVALSAGAERLNQAQTRFWQAAMTGARAISPEEFMGLMFRLSEIIKEEVDQDAARRILARADREVCGGALGIAQP